MALALVMMMKCSGALVSKAATPVWAVDEFVVVAGGVGEPAAPAAASGAGLVIAT